jgi:hypothetical protein
MARNSTHPDDFDRIQYYATRSEALYVQLLGDAGTQVGASTGRLEDFLFRIVAR